MENQKILVLDFGGQYNQLIARRVRDLGVYSEVRPYTTSLEEIRSAGYCGIIFTGGPNSVFEENSPICSADIFELGIPILGICYGAQVMAHLLGGTVQHAETREYGSTDMVTDQGSALFAKVPQTTSCWMSHTDFIAVPPAGFAITAHTSSCPVAAMEDRERKLYAVQFHPEVQHTPQGQDILRGFLFDVCGCVGDWLMSSFIDRSVSAIREKVGN